MCDKPPRFPVLKNINESKKPYSGSPESANGGVARMTLKLAQMTIGTKSSRNFWRAHLTPPNICVSQLPHLLNGDIS